MAQDPCHELTRLVQGTDDSGKGICSLALWMFKPPKELGRDAFIHDLSDTWSPARLVRESLIMLSKAMIESWIVDSGQALRARLNFDRARQERRRVISIYESSRSWSLDTADLIFYTLFMVVSSQNTGGHTVHVWGHPASRTQIRLNMGALGGMVLQEALASLGTKRSDLALLSFNPLAGPSSSMISRNQ